MPHILNIKLSKSRDISIISGVVCAFIIFHLLSLNLKGAQKPEDFALGKYTTSHLGYYGEEKNLISTIGYKDFDELVSTAVIMKSNGKQIILHMGASQTHSINQYKDGDALAVYYLNNHIKNRKDNNYFVVQISQPNLSLHEMLAMYLSFTDRAGFSPDVLLTALTYDDLKEGVRQEVMDNYVNFSKTKLLNEKGILNLIKEKAKAEASKSNSSNENISGAGKSSKTKSGQEVLEEYLVSELEDVWPPYEDRSNMLARIEFELMNLNVGIRQKIATNIRVADVTSHERAFNEEALYSLLNIATSKDVKVLLYSSPIGPTGNYFAFDRVKYEDFYNDVRIKVKVLGIPLIDLEKIVPDKYWGFVKKDKPDPFHFKDYGHKLLAIDLNNYLGSNLGDY